MNSIRAFLHEGEFINQLVNVTYFPTTISSYEECLFPCIICKTDTLKPLLVHTSNRQTCPKHVISNYKSKPLALLPSLPFLSVLARLTLTHRNLRQNKQMKPYIRSSQNDTMITCIDFETSTQHVLVLTLQISKWSNQTFTK